MRTLASVLVLVAALVAPLTALADPADVYTDFVNHGHLSCDHPKSDLEAVLHDATMDQYGDPLKLAQLKQVIRRQLATGQCTGQRPAGGSGTGTVAAAAAAGSQGGGGSSFDWTPLIVVAAIAAVGVGGWYGRRLLRPGP